jgi:hypothetical protein
MMFYGQWGNEHKKVLQNYNNDVRYFLNNEKERFMKRLFTLTLASLCIVLSLQSCGNQTKGHRKIELNKKVTEPKFAFTLNSIRRINDGRTTTVNGKLLKEYLIEGTVTNTTADDTLYSAEIPLESAGGFYAFDVADIEKKEAKGSVKPGEMMQITGKANTLNKKPLRFRIFTEFKSGNYAGHYWVDVTEL